MCCNLLAPEKFEAFLVNIPVKSGIAIGIDRLRTQLCRYRLASYVDNYQVDGCARFIGCNDDGDSRIIIDDTGNACDLDG